MHGAFHYKQLPAGPIALAPLDSPRRAARCVCVGGVLAAIVAVVCIMVLFVASGNGTATANRKIFFSISLLLMIGCAASSYRAIRIGSPLAALSFVGWSAVFMLLTFVFMIVDAVVSECEENVIWFWLCTEGEDQNVLYMVSQDAAILFILFLFPCAGACLWYKPPKAKEESHAVVQERDEDDEHNDVSLDDDDVV